MFTFTFYTHWLRKYMGSRSRGGGRANVGVRPPQKTKTFSFAIWGGGGHFVTFVSVGRGGGVIK